MFRIFPLCLVVAVVGFWPAVMTGGECGGGCAGEPTCEIGVTMCLIDAGRSREAVDYLKPLAKQNPHSSLFVRLLARAYLADDNYFWAQRTLQAFLSSSPNDCVCRSWLAWVHVRVGDFDLAREVLDQEGCPTTVAGRNRWLLLRSFMEYSEEGTVSASLSLGTIRDAGELFSEDESFWLFLRRATQPNRIEPVSARLELGGGYTSNAKAGSPADPGDTGPSSAMGRMDLFGRLAWPNPRRVRPLLEGSLKGHGIAASEADDLSYLALSIRPAILLGEDLPRVLVGYRGDLLLLNEDERGQFYEGHRGEVEFESGDFTFFGGGGYRRFAERGRTRWEMDGGFGRSLSLPRRIRVLCASSFRYYDATGDAYDLVGGTGLAVARMGLPHGSYARAAATVGLDYFFDSGGARGELAYGTEDKRFDVLTQLSTEVWSPSWHGVRAGLGYEFAWRESTADEASEDYDYDEHRVLLKARWTFDLDPWAPRVVSPENHVPLEYGVAVDRGATLENERIQDLLRQDESIRRGSSCIE